MKFRSLFVILECEVNSLSPLIHRRNLQLVFIRFNIRRKVRAKTKFSIVIGKKKLSKIKYDISQKVRSHKDLYRKILQNIWKWGARPFCEPWFTGSQEKCEPRLNFLFYLFLIIVYYLLFIFLKPKFRELLIVIMFASINYLDLIYL